MELGLHHRMFPKLHKRIYDCSSKKNFILNGIASYEFEGGGKVNVEHHEPNATAKGENDNYPKKKKERMILMTYELLVYNPNN